MGFGCGWDGAEDDGRWVRRKSGPTQLLFNSSLRVDIQRSRVTSDGGLILVRELDEGLGLSALMERHLTDSRGKNTQLPLADLLRQSIYSRLAGYEDVNDAELMVRALRRAGCDPTYERVETPEAMQAALAREPWDLIIADYSMPHFSGLAALKLLQDKELDLPFIVVSGSAGENVAVEAMKAGAHDYILKGNLARLAPAMERELRDAEVRRERRRAESRYRNLFNSVPVGVFITTPDGKVIEANPRFVAMLGFADEKSLKRVNIRELWMHPEERPRLTALIAREGAVENLEMEFRGADGRTVWCVVSAHVMYDAAGKIDHYEGVSVDITERKHAEQELNRARCGAGRRAHQVGVHDQHEPRDSHAAQRHHRDERTAARLRSERRTV